jgi:hypothetical protein
MQLSFWLLTTLLLVSTAVLNAADTLPPLQNGKVPTNLDELWSGFDPRKEPLETEVLQEWEQDGAVCRVVRYQVGTFKSALAKVAAFYAYPKGGTKLPALLSMHGGGQSAGFDSVLTDAKRGYASISINWGGNKLNFGRAAITYQGPQTDWGKLDATHPPQRNKANHFAGELTPDEFTLDSVESPRNSNWFLVLMAARRAITFLENQPEVDGTRIGASGHSMGGKLTTNLAGIDHRLRAAVPSCGGSGDLTEAQAELPGGLKTKVSPLKLACVSDNAYLPRIRCPILWLSPTNDFHAHIDNMAWNWRALPDDQLRLSISPHFNHRHTEEHQITQLLWFEEHLKGVFKMPHTPQCKLVLNTKDGVPLVTVVPDESQHVKQVAVYYSLDSHALTRFWRDAKALKVGSQWQANCPVMSIDQPIFVYADVTYEMPASYREPRSDYKLPESYHLSSRVLSAAGSELKASGVIATDKPDRLIDDGSRGWHDWYQINWGHPPLWNAYTRKLKDAKWRGPNGAKLVFEIRSHSDNSLVVSLLCNTWGAMVPGKPAVEYSVLKSLKGSPEWQTVTVSLAELTAIDPKVTQPLTDWQTVCELSISPSGQVVQDGHPVKVNAKAWQGPREIRNLRWEGGEYPRPNGINATVNPEEFQKSFNEAIKKSLEQEKREREGK